MAHPDLPTGLIRIATFNLRRDGFWPGKNRWASRRELAVTLIAENELSVIGVQELLPSMRQDLLRSLEEFGSWGISRTKGLRGEHSDILVNKQQWQVEKHQTFWLSKNPNRIASRAYYAFFPRICTMCQLTHRETGNRLRVFNTHFDHICGPARMLGAKTILQMLAKLQQEQPLPAIIMGDLNANPDNPAIRFFSENHHGIAGLRFVDAFASCNKGQALASYHRFKGSNKGARIDYIFVTDDLEVAECYLDRRGSPGRFPSDHYPMIAAIKWKEPGKVDL